MKTIPKLLCIFCFLLLNIHPLCAQWDEEQDYIRSVAESLPLDSIEVYLGNSFCRVYHYDFFRHYIGYTQYMGSKKPQEYHFVYDAFGLLTEEYHITEDGLETKIIYQYDSLGNQTGINKCNDYLETDIIDGKRVMSTRKKRSCSNTRVDFNEDRSPIGLFGVRDSVVRPYKLYEYDESKKLIKAKILFNDGLAYEEIWEYDSYGRKTKFWLQKGRDKKLKTEWEYDEKGRLSSMINYSVQYGLPHINALEEEVCLLDSQFKTQSIFKYDKKDRVSKLSAYINDKPGIVLTFKYFAPKK